MKQTKLALSAVMIVAVGLIGANFVTGSEMTEQDKITVYGESSPIFGHITVVHSDSDGNVLSYQQTDNIVTAQGKNCMAEQVFGLAGATCDAVGNTVFNTIGLFGASETFANTDVETTHTLLTASGLTITIADSVGENTAASGATNQITDITELFTSGATQTVTGAGLFNDAEDALFAGRAFGSSVSMISGDTLSVTWSITLGT